MKKLLAVCMLSISLCVLAQDKEAKKTYSATDLSKNNQVSFRSEITECDIFFSPFLESIGRASDGIGYRISSNNVEDFKNSLEKLIEIHGIEKLNSSRFYATGIAMRKGSEHKRALEEILKKADAPESAKVMAITVPGHLVNEGATNFIKNTFEDFVYNLPLPSRFYQKPLKEEVVAGFKGMTPIEVSNTVALYSTVPFLPGHSFMDVHITSINHGIILSIYNIYQKWMVNWLLSPGETYVEKYVRNKSRELGVWLAKTFSKENLNNPKLLHRLLTEKLPAWGQRFSVYDTKLFAKQMMLSMPFVTNFKIFGNYSQLSNFFIEQGLPTATQVMEEMGSFAMTEGLTIGLQTYFYKVTQTQRIMGWLQTIKEEKRSMLAREFVNYVKIPILLLDSVVLFFASSGALPLTDIIPVIGEHLILKTSIGTFEPNLFQLGLVGLTVWGNKWYSNAYLNRKFGKFIANRRLKESRKINPEFLKDRHIPKWHEKAMDKFLELTGLSKSIEAPGL